MIKRMTTLDDIHFTVGKIDGKVSMLMQEVTAQGKIQDDRAIALEIRVRAVESRQHWYAGAAAAISALAAYVFKGWTAH